MAWMIGVDEAGYGPNLGPLVVAATVWNVREGGTLGNRIQGSGFRVPGSGSHAEAGEVGVAQRNATAVRRRRSFGTFDLYECLESVVSCCWDPDTIAIADSKSLYTPALGLGRLERGVHAAMFAIGRLTQWWTELVDGLVADPEGRRLELPWHDEYEVALPVDSAQNDAVRFGQRLQDCCHEADVMPVAVRARLVFPAEFNTVTEYHGSKSAALSHATLELVRNLLDTILNSGPRPLNPRFAPQTLNVEPCYIVCDKHGGRNHYMGLLQHFFPEHWIDVLRESRQESSYRWGPTDAPVEIHFRRGGESFLPAALASMTAKYLRELAMGAENRFWCARVPQLRPTAGYPVDAKRFKHAIAAEQRRLGIEDRILWRKR